MKTFKALSEVIKLISIAHGENWLCSHNSALDHLLNLHSSRVHANESILSTTIEILLIWLSNVIYFRYLFALAIEFTFTHGGVDRGRDIIFTPYHANNDSDCLLLGLRSSELHKL